MTQAEPPEYPLRIVYDDDEDEVLSTPEEVECNLEWFDSADPEYQATVYDARGRRVRLKVERLKIITNELM